MAALILASASPRRAQLLRMLAVDFRVQPADIDETHHAGEAIADYVRRMAREKAAAVAALADDADAWVLGADTTVTLDGDSLGKPADAHEGRAMLARLSGRAHAVVSAVCLHRGGREHLCTVETQVEFCKLAEAEIAAYLATDEPWDKAGGYAIQGLAGAFVRRIEGSYTNVVGLPLVETRELLHAAGVQTGVSGEVSGEVL